MAPFPQLIRRKFLIRRSIGRGGGFSCALLIGGTGMGSQLRDLRNRPRLVRQKNRLAS